MAEHWTATILRPCQWLLVTVLLLHTTPLRRRLPQIQLCGIIMSRMRSTRRNLEVLCSTVRRSQASLFRI